jgi:hypothetical protein
MRPVSNHTRVEIALPLLANIEPNAVWLPTRGV